MIFGTHKAAQTPMAPAASRLAAAAETLTGYQSSGFSPLVEHAARARTSGQSPLSVMVKLLAEGEGVDLGARTEEGDLEGAVGYS